MEKRPSSMAGAGIARHATRMSILAAWLMAMPAATWSQTGGPPEDSPVLRFETDTTIEYTARSADVLVEDYAHKNAIDIRRNFLDKAPLERLVLEYGAPQGLNLAVEAELRAEWTGDFFTPTNLVLLGESGNPVAIQNKNIARGVAYWLSPNLDIYFGRDRVDLNDGLKGGFLPSFRIPYYDAIRAQGRLGPLTMDWMVSTIQARKSWEANEYDDDSYDVNPNVTRADPIGSINSYYGWEDSTNPTIIVEALHHFAWDFGAFRMGVSGHTMMSRRNNKFVLTDFFPVVSWHQTGVLQTNNSMVLDFRYDFNDRLALLAQAGFDDINGAIFGIGDTAAPTIDAYALGVRYTGDMPAGGFGLYAEVGYTQRLWGNYDGTHNMPYDQNPFMRFIARYLVDGGSILLPLTSPYGPGALWLSASGEFPLGVPGLSGGFELLLLRRDRETDLVSTDFYGPEADKGQLYFASLSLPLRYKLGYLELSAKPAALLRDKDFWVEASLSVSWRYRSETSIGRRAWGE